MPQTWTEKAREQASRYHPLDISWQTLSANITPKWEEVRSRADQIGTPKAQELRKAIDDLLFGIMNGGADAFRQSGTWISKVAASLRLDVASDREYNLSWQVPKLKEQLDRLEADIKAGKNAIPTIDRAIEALKALGTAKADLRVRSNPSGARIYVDGKYTGKKTSYTLEAAPGEHTVVVHKDGYYTPPVRTVTLRPGIQKSVIFTLDKIEQPQPEPQQPEMDLKTAAILTHDFIKYKLHENLWGVLKLFIDKSALRQYIESRGYSWSDYENVTGITMSKWAGTSMMIGGGVNRVLPKVSEETAAVVAKENAGEAIAKMGAELNKNPRAFIQELETLTNDQLVALYKALDEDVAGRILHADINRAFGKYGTAKAARGMIAAIKAAHPDLIGFLNVLSKAAIGVFVITEIPNLFQFSILSLSEMSDTLRKEFTGYTISLGNLHKTFDKQMGDEDFIGARQTLAEIKKLRDTFAGSLSRNRPELFAASVPETVIEYVTFQHGKARKNIKNVYDSFSVLLDVEDSRIAAAERQLADVQPEGATLKVASYPKGADIFINGPGVQAQTPHTFKDLKPGEYSVWVHLKGYKTSELRTVKLEAGGYDEESFPLEKGEPDEGRITLTSEPTHAKVYVNGKYAGITPFNQAYPVGDYTIGLMLDGYEPVDYTVHLGKGDVFEKSPTLTESATGPENKGKGYLAFNPTPYNARIKVGLTWQDYPGPQMVMLPPGTYNVLVRADGYKDYETSVNILSGSVVPLDVLLEKETPPEEEKPPEEQKQTAWRVDVASEPPGAKILVNGFFTGKWTPDFVLLNPGDYTISVEKSGYEPESEDITLEEFD